MKKFFLALFVALLSFAWTSCGDSPEQLVDDVIQDGIKCEKRVYDKAKCDQLSVAYRDRKDKFSIEDQKWIEKEIMSRFFAELKKVNDEARNK